VVGVVASLAHPGGNVTGLSAFATELAGKRVELLKEARPSIARVGFLQNMGNPASPPQWQSCRRGGLAENPDSPLSHHSSWQPTALRVPPHSKPSAFDVAPTPPVPSRLKLEVENGPNPIGTNSPTARGWEKPVRCGNLFP